MRKKITYLVMVLLVSCFLAGCQEIENPDFTDKVANQQASIVEKVDLSRLSAPKELFVYSAALWKREPEEIAEVFLGKGFKEGETYAEGRTFVQNTGTQKEQIVIATDGGMAYFGETGHANDNGVIFSRLDLGELLNGSNNYQELCEEYYNTGKISGGESKEEDVISGIEKGVSQYLEQLGMEGYKLDATGVLDSEGLDGRKCYVMYWKQVVDGIPLSNDCFMNTGNKEVYNYRHQVCHADLSAGVSVLETHFLENELIDWRNSDIIRPDKQLKKYSLVSANKAFEKVKECYPPVTEDEETPRLERAELQYQLLGRKGKYYLYPIWLFGVCKKNELTGAPAWEYYMMDAVTGDFLSDIPEELL